MAKIFAMVFIFCFFIVFMKILELCLFSAGICGVWSRVLEESKRLAALGHEVRVFSSDRTKGSEDIVLTEDKIGNVKIRRFPARHLGGESFMSWDFEAEAFDYSPDVIIAHNYRQIHTTRALKIARKLEKSGKRCRVFLVSHAPFVEGDVTRSFAAKIAVKFYDAFIGRASLRKFEKILVISKWEIPFLVKCGAPKEKIVYAPNGISEEFFRQETRVGKNILFFGRISPIKNIETLIEAMSLIRDRKIKLEIVGPAEEDYLESLKELVGSLKLNNRVSFGKPIFKLNDKIRKIDSAKVFVLPSRKEGMPQSLVEAMARGKIVIGSDNIAIRDLISDGQNGFLFELGNARSLAEKIDLALSGRNKKMEENARQFAEGFSWEKIIKLLVKILEFNRD